MEVAAVERIRSVDPALPVPVARPALDGSTVVTAVVDGATHLVRLLPLLPGRTAAPAELDPAAIEHLGEVVGRIGLALRGFFHPAAGRTIWWDQRHLPELARRVSLSEPPERRELLGGVLERFNRRVVPALPTLRSQLIHNDVTLDNLLLDDDQRVTGIIDFGDMAHTALILDVPATLQSLVRDRTDLFEVTDAFLAGYASVLPLEAAEAAAARRPARRADGADDPHLRVAHAAAPRERVHPRLGGPGVGAARADGGDRLRRRVAADGGHRPRAASSPRPRRRARWPAGIGCWGPRSSRFPTGTRSTSCAVTARGWRRPTVGATSMPTTTCRWSDTPTRASWPPSPARPRP